MFQGCTALTRAPKIAATKYGTGCFQDMFRDCSSLTYIDVDMTTWPGASYMSGWVTGVSKVGIFSCPQALPEEYATSRIPVGWTVLRK